MLNPHVITPQGHRPVALFRREADGHARFSIGGVGGVVALGVQPKPAPQADLEGFFAQRPFYVAHRLGGTEFPEHTMTGLRASLARGFKAVEFSTYRSSDGAFVGSHDWTTERTTGVRHEIWNTSWASLSALQQPAGPLIRLEDMLAAVPEDTIIVLDHKATSARAGTPPADDLASEVALFDRLEALMPAPQRRVVWKLFADASSAERARDRGYKTMCMLYPEEVADADLNRWDILGMAWNAPKKTWDTLLATGKPTIAHIIVNAEQAATGLSRGAHGLMSSVPSVVAPHA